MVKRTSDSLLVAVWPGIGQVGLTAGYYLMSKLRMHEEKPPRTMDLFDLDHVDVEKGLARAGPIPEDHLFASAKGVSRARLNVMIGESMPSSNGVEYCRRILDRAEKLGVGQVVTFSAVAANSHPLDPSKVLGVATEVNALESLRRHGIETLEAGQIMGMNGLLLAAAAERGLSAVCLMGVMPALASAIPYPKASHAVLSAFSRLTEVEIDLHELEEYGRMISQKLNSGLEKLKQVLQVDEDEVVPTVGDADEEPAEPETEQPLDPEQRVRLELLFRQAAADPSKAFELKRELDRLSVFKEYEDRFLDLFRGRPS
jgi:predicted ATP-grasp superfamily ATP-dependent carboligase